MKYGLRIRPVIFTDKTICSLSEEGSAFIILYLWRKKFRYGGHFQAGFVGKNETVTLHNPKVTYSSLKDMLAEKKKREHMWFCVALAVAEIPASTPQKQKEDAGISRSYFTSVKSALGDAIRE